MPDTQRVSPAAPLKAPPAAPGLYRKGRRVVGYTLRSLVAATRLDFDRAHGVDTHDDVRLRELLTEPIHDAHGRSRYWPIAVKHFHFAMGLVPRPLERWSFLDVGSGKGRAVLLAMGYPFREVAGVELSPALHATAQRNLQRYVGPRRCGRVQLQLGDATRAVLPAGDLVAFLYNPFVGEDLRGFLDHLEESLRQAPRQLLLVYSNPMGRAALEGRPGFRLLFEGNSPMDPLRPGVRRLAVYGAGLAAPAQG
ncbi:hypothetical protein FGE12_13820 [Aggregicoccus sp. 17bor-14]|uniref:class I SAM-dependent methyltransferase n=1 Tax=Myxococcaceae TaxID=31 RepID=UPI00129D09C2|nr:MULTISPECIES: class I SAM-dependent methyltransferase [Myxococcaceae]MBF5043470.1 hypothetical protein [Simulacricoccus sp. 17bor-14]MRI89228.1 hypothetical protein [Aggregicoccus sp. 17bor-14]